MCIYLHHTLVLLWMSWLQQSCKEDHGQWAHQNQGQWKLLLTPNIQTSIVFVNLPSQRLYRSINSWNTCRQMLSSYSTASVRSSSYSYCLSIFFFFLHHTLHTLWHLCLMSLCNLKCCCNVCYLFYPVYNSCLLPCLLSVVFAALYALMTCLMLHAGTKP